MKLKIGDSVIMPEPLATDLWNFGDFVARIVKIYDDGTICVCDQDDHHFDVDSDRVRLYND